LKSLISLLFLTVVIGLLNIACEAPQRTTGPVQIQTESQPEPEPAITDTDPTTEEESSTAKLSTVELAPAQSQSCTAPTG
jgi:hypothetical protein